MSEAEGMHFVMFCFFSLFFLIANGFDKTHQKLSESMHTQHMIHIVLEYAILYSLYVR